MVDYRSILCFVRYPSDYNLWINISISRLRVAMVKCSVLRTSIVIRNIISYDFGTSHGNKLVSFNLTTSTDL